MNEYWLWRRKISEKRKKKRKISEEKLKTYFMIDSEKNEILIYKGVSARFTKDDFLTESFEKDEDLFRQLYCTEQFDDRDDLSFDILFSNNA